MTTHFNEFFGKDVPILSGAIHYFRVHPEYWRDRLEKLRACGYNTVETYIPWNFHEPKEGQFAFDGYGDVCQFIEIADDIGLKVIIRPGPYICAEWEFGGLPAWLNKDRNMRLRCAWPAYLEKVKNWFEVLLPKFIPYLHKNGGPVFAMQIENEYGSYGNDKEYLLYIKNLMIDLGMDCMFFTSDGPTINMLHGGTLKDVWMTANFGSRPEEGFKILRAFQPNGPDMCCEYWCGWFDHWGDAHHTRDAADVADVLERMVKEGGSVNMFMFHGGTSHGFWNGANKHGNEYQPTVNSYDYHALVSESGDLTPAYFACKAVLEKYFGPAPELNVKNLPAKAYGDIELSQRISLFDVLDAPVKAAAPLTFEELDQEYGFVLYRSVVEMPPVPRSFIEEQNWTMDLHISGLYDRAVVFVDGKQLGILYRNNPNEKLALPMPKADQCTVDILVENMGRVNYGTDLAYPCGITGTVRIAGKAHFGWEMYRVPLDPQQMNDIVNANIQTTNDSAVFFKGSFDVTEKCDTFLRTDNFKKGVAFINGFNLGRYWEIGPTKTMYIPAPLLKIGENELIIFETDGLKGDAVVTLVDKAEL